MHVTPAYLTRWFVCETLLMNLTHQVAWLLVALARRPHLYWDEQKHLSVHTSVELHCA